MQMHPQALTLVSHHLCPYVQRAAISLAEKAVPFERVYVDLADKPAWFLDLSPLGKTPVLKVDDRAIFESAVILEYLEETGPHPLHPADPLRRAEHRAWIISQGFPETEPSKRQARAADIDIDPRRRTLCRILFQPAYFIFGFPGQIQHDPCVRWRG